MPAYEGKGQPPARRGWLRSFLAPWRGLTPQYGIPRTTRSNGHASAAALTAVTGGAPDAQSSPPVSSGAAPSGSQATTKPACDSSSGEPK
jgi:hypothetical protein